MRFVKYNRLGILWGCMIIIMTLLPGRVFPQIPAFIDLFKPDKLIHLFVFGMFAFLQLRGFTIQDVFLQLRKNAIMLTLLTGFLMGGLTEVVQHYFIPMRTGSVVDFIANVLGSLIGLGVFYFWRNRFYPQNPTV
jgi:VanZ family protein